MLKPNKRFKSLHSFSDIIDTMVRGLKKEWVKVNMMTYGSIGEDEKGDVVCFGCAATNTLCEIMNEPFSTTNIHHCDRAEKFNYDITKRELSYFEEAINDLRIGDIELCMTKLTEISYLFSFKLPSADEVVYDKTLPVLHTFDYKENLHHYEKYAKRLRKKGL